MLLHLLDSLEDVSIGIVHFDHQLRGKESDSDREFVVEMGKRFGYEVHVLKEDIGALATQQRMSLEEAGSKQRRTRFSELKNDLQYDLIATGQHWDDQVETILMNLFQGSGIRGLCGISEIMGDLIRPLLDFQKEEIVAYAQQEKIIHRHDSSNDEKSFLRNNIRLNVVPQIKNDFQDELSACIQSIIQSAQRLNVLVETSVESIDIKEFNAYYAPKIALGMSNVPDYFSPIQKAIFDRAFQLISLMPQGISTRHYSALKQLLSDDAIGVEIQLPAGITACRSRKGIVFCDKRQLQWQQNSIPDRHEKRFPFFNLKNTMAAIGDHFKDPAYFWDLGYLEKLKIRMIEQGDRMIVNETGKTLSVNQMLQSARVSPYLKETYPVVEYNGEILWVPGIRTAHSSLLSDALIKANNLKHCIRVQFQKGTFE